VYFYWCENAHRYIHLVFNIGQRGHKTVGTSTHPSLKIFPIFYDTPVFVKDIFFNSTCLYYYYATCGWYGT
jgi:hypothetical protein